jgi:chromosome segregation ATPase
MSKQKEKLQETLSSLTSNKAELMEKMPGLKDAKKAAKAALISATTRFNFRDKELKKVSKALTLLRSKIAATRLKIKACKKG